MVATSFIVRVSSLCDLGCHYCFASPGFQGYRMSREMLEFVIRQIDSLGLDSAQMTWHGGEPLMLGIDGFEYGVELQNSLATSFCNAVQTNGVLVNDAYADFFVKNDFSVGISIDGYEKVHNANRPFRNGKGSFDRVIRGLRLLQSKGLDVASISVISDYCDPDLFFEFITSLGLSSFAMKPCSGEWEHSMSLEQYTVFVRRVHQLVASSEEDIPACREFLGWASNILSGANVADLCLQSGKCGQFVMIDVNGDVFPCDELASNEFRWGNITEIPLKEILGSAKRQEFLDRVSRQNETCKESCEAFDACQGGCTSCHLLFDKSGYCGFLKTTIADIRQMVRQGVESWADTEDESMRQLVDPKLLS